MDPNGLFSYSVTQIDSKLDHPINLPGSFNQNEPDLMMSDGKSKKLTNSKLQPERFLIGNNQNKLSESFESFLEHRKSKFSSNFSASDNTQKKKSTYNYKDVKSLLRRLSLLKYYYLFEAHEVTDLETFRELSDRDLVEMGIHNRNVRITIMAAIKRLK